jgi:hypothetical protein
MANVFAKDRFQSKSAADMNEFGCWSKFGDEMSASLYCCSGMQL